MASSRFSFCMFLLGSLIIAVPAQGQPSLKLPFAPGVKQCTTGTNVAPNHQDVFTRNDLDFDTDNNADEFVIVAADGVAYFIPTAGDHSFGNHVNVDHGPVDPTNPDGPRYFTIYAHLKSTLVAGGQFVRQGQVLGIENDTGFSRGDHIHFGLHTGNPRVDALQSTSVSVTLITRDATTNEVAFGSRAGNQFTCGLGTVGHLYASNNFTLAPLTGDWNGDGLDTRGLYDYVAARFTLDGGGPITFGIPGDLPIVGDWNGDRISDIGVFRPFDISTSNSRFFLDLNRDGVADKVLAFGNRSDIPLSGDWNGDGRDTVGVFRPATAQFFLDDTNDGLADRVVALGIPGDFPAVGDWDGDGDDDIGVFRGGVPNQNTNSFFLDVNLTGGNAELGPFVLGDRGLLPNSHLG